MFDAVSDVNPKHELKCVQKLCDIIMNIYVYIWYNYGSYNKRIMNSQKYKNT